MCIAISKGRQAVLLLACAILAVGATLTTADARPAGGDKKDAQTDLDKFQGNWTVASLIAEGQDITDLIKDIKVSVSGDKMTISIMGKDIKLTIKLDGSKKPKQIDLKVDDQKEIGVGIYAIDGDTLKICAGEGSERPKEFSGDGMLKLIVLKKAKSQCGDESPLSVPAQAPAAGGKSDKDKLQGTWKITSAVKGGKEAPAEFVDKIKIAFKGDKFIISFDGKEVEGDFKLDSTKKPRHIDVSLFGKSVPGIYELNGDTLKLCMPEGDAAERPKEFKGDDPKISVLICKRDKADKDQSVRQAPAPQQPSAQSPSPSPSPSQAGGKNKSDRDRMQGVWDVESVIEEGKEMAKEIAGIIKFVVKDDVVKIELGKDLSFELKFKLDETKKPKTIDLSMDGKDKGLGIYEMTDDTIKLCIVDLENSKDRPKEFQAPANSPNKLVVLKRAKKAKQGGMDPARPGYTVAVGGGKKTDEDLMQGTWQITSVILGGVKNPDKETNKVQLIVKGDKMTIVFDGQAKDDATFKIDATKNPKQIDIVPPKGNKLEGIYELTGDAMKICFTDTFGRPTAFKSDANTKVGLMEFKRVQPKSDKKAAIESERPDFFVSAAVWDAPQVAVQPEFVVFVSEEADSVPAQEQKAKEGDKTGKKTDLELAQGSWQPVAGHKDNGKKMSKDDLDDFMLTITKEQARLGPDPRTGQSFRINLNEAKEPKQFDLLQGKEVLVKGIYEMKGDTLKVCFREEKDRPTSFKLDEKTNRGMVIEYKRIVPIAEDKKPDLERFLGLWKFAKARGDGEDAPGHLMADMRWLFNKEGKLTLVRPLGDQVGEYKLDPAKKHIDLIMMKGDKKEVVQGIYKLEGTNLTLCFADKVQGGKRPVDFTAEKGSKQVMFVLDLVERHDKTFAQAGARSRAVNDLKQIALALHSYHDVNGGMPAHAIYSKDGKTPLLSWRVAILPYIEQQALYQQFKLDEPWDSPHNKKLSTTIPEIYMPRVMVKGEKDMAGMTFYQVVTGLNTMFHGPKGIKLTQITDGTSNTIMVVEASSPVIWTKPDDVQMPRNSKAAPKLGGMFGDVTPVAFADGSVRIIRRDIRPATLRALITPNGGEAVNPDDN